jgi:hypothetical protein
MAATGYTPILIYSSATASAAPLAANLQQGELAINVVDGKLYYKDNSNVVQLLSNSNVNSNLSWSAANNTLTVLGTGSIQVPSGTTAQDPATPAAGMLRFNTDLGGFEGYNGSAWGGIGGAQAGGAIVTNKKIASVSYTIGTTENGFSVGPITVPAGVTITIAPDSRWVIL